MLKIIDFKKYLENSILIGGMIPNDPNHLVIPDGTIEITRNMVPETTRSVTIPDSVTRIGNRAFLDINLSNVIIPDSVTNIGEFAFFRTQLRNVNIPDSVTTIGRYAFSQTQLRNVTISNSVTTIENFAFSDTFLNDVTIPNRNTNIAEFAFDDHVIINRERSNDSFVHINEDDLSVDSNLNLGRAYSLGSNTGESNDSFVIIGENVDKSEELVLPENINNFYSTFDPIRIGMSNTHRLEIDYNEDIMESLVENFNNNQNIFEGFFVKEKDTSAIDMGGVTRQFFTRFSEYLLFKERKQSNNQKDEEDNQEDEEDIKFILSDNQEDEEDNQEYINSKPKLQNKKSDLIPRYFTESGNGYFSLFNFYDNEGNPEYDLHHYFIIGKIFGYAVKSKNNINIPLNPLLLHLLLSKEIVESSDKNSNFLDLVDILGEYPIKDYFLDIHRLVNSEDLTLKFKDIDDLNKVIEIFNKHDDVLLKNFPYNWLMELNNNFRNSGRKSNNDTIDNDIEKIEETLLDLRKKIGEEKDKGKISSLFKKQSELRQAKTILIEKKSETNKEIDPLLEQWNKSNVKITIFGKNLNVSYESKDKFILYMIKYYSFLANYKETMEFIKGFHSIISPDHLKQLDIKDLDLLIVGQGVDLDFILKNLVISETKYKGEEYLNEEKKNFIIDIISKQSENKESDYLGWFLNLFTGSRRLSAKGLNRKLEIKFRRFDGKNPNDPERCFDTNTHVCDRFIYHHIARKFLLDDENGTWQEKLENHFSLENIIQLGKQKNNQAGGFIKLFSN